MLLLSFLVIVVSITFAVSVLLRCGLDESNIKGNHVKVTSKIKSQFLKEQRRSKENGDKNNEQH